jgi:hypothetical protein
MPTVQMWRGPKIGLVLTGLVVVTVWAVRYFITGNPLNGKPRDNATFLHEATADYRGKPEEKLSGPRWRSWFSTV